MPSTQKSSATMSWLKQFTTSTFHTINAKVNRIAFIKNNKKYLAILLLCWCALVIGSYLFLDSIGKRQSAAFMDSNAAKAKVFANQSAPMLLEEDVLGLNRALNEFDKTQDVLFAAIMNHENRLVAHTDPEKFNQLYEGLRDAVALDWIDDVKVESGFLEQGQETITFSHSITYSGVKIGAAVFGLPKRVWGAISTRIRLYQLLVFLFSTVAAAAIVLVLARRRGTSRGKPISVSHDGSVIGPYQLKDKIAQGGMAELYTAAYVREDGFKRKVAIKKVLPHLAENDDFIKMFIREARLAALLQHPNIVQIFDFGKIHNTYFIAMEYIDGLNLGQVMAELQKPLPADMAIFVVMKISLGLHYSHAKTDEDSGQELGIVHRDISPQNILISSLGEVKISDFGISKATTEPSLTQAGVIKGKLSYLAPEQALGKEVDKQADIYALGLVLYEILSGKRLYQFDSDIQAIRTIPEMVIPPLTSVRPDIPEKLSHIVMRCLEKDKVMRYPDAMSLHKDLSKLRAKLQMSYSESDLSNFIKLMMDHA